MTYAAYLETLPADHCIFCSQEFRDTAVRTYEYWFLVPNRAPYCPDHLMIIPHVHLERVSELSPEAWAEAHKIAGEAKDWFERRGHRGYNFLVRDELELGAIGKSIAHLHIHFIPGIFMGPGEKWEFTKRPFMTEDQLRATIRDIGNTWI